MALLAAAGVLGWVARTVVRNEANRLLTERTNELALVFTASIANTEASIKELGTALRVSGNSPAAFDLIAGDDVAAGPGKLSFAWLRPTPGGFRVEAAQGDAFRVGDVIGDERTKTLDLALTSGKLATTPVLGTERRLGFALGPPAAPPGTVLYRESELGPVARPRAADTAPFNELEVVLYDAPSVDSGQILVTTAESTPLRGAVRYKEVPVGASTLLLAVSAARPLLGASTSASPWIAFGAGCVAALLTVSVVETQRRRRDLAEILYLHERSTAETLQRSLLPALPAVDDVGLAARYLAGGAGQEVGGDWFDVFAVEGGRLAVVIGDVMGHDLAAAAAMAQVRATLRAFAWPGDEPSAVLDRLDAFVSATAVTPLVSVFYGLLDPPNIRGARRLTYANAGHLPPLLRTADGVVRPLSNAKSMIIAGLAAHGRDLEIVDLPVGSTLVLYTDGLVESPAEPMDTSVQRLERDFADCPPDATAETISDRLLARSGQSDLGDDIAILVVQILAGTGPSTEAPSRRDPGVFRP